MRAATYRVQLHVGFTFDDAAAVVDYLAALGVSHLYCSPYLQAAKGSTHGYDVIDHGRLNDELGGAAAHSRLVSRLAGYCQTLTDWSCMVAGKVVLAVSPPPQPPGAVTARSASR